MQRKRVLLVDDDAVFVDALSAVLETRFDVVTAANGTEALVQLQRERPDVLVLDVMMNHLSEGFDVARRVKADPETSHIPVIMLTAVDQVYDFRMEVQDSYVPHDRYLEKPVAPETMLEVIEDVLAPRRA
ncbi:MAG: response regulator [bacterium]|nr:response regulator [bacterium]